jgi:hypothetical protein
VARRAAPTNRGRQRSIRTLLAQRTRLTARRESELNRSRTLGTGPPKGAEFRAKIRYFLREPFKADFGQDGGPGLEGNLPCEILMNCLHRPGECVILEGIPKTPPPRFAIRRDFGLGVRLQMSGKIARRYYEKTPSEMPFRNSSQCRLLKTVISGSPRLSTNRNSISRMRGSVVIHSRAR